MKKFRKVLKKILLSLWLITSLWAQEDVSAFIEKPRFEHVFILDLKDMPWTSDHPHLRAQEAEKTARKFFKKVGFLVSNAGHPAEEDNKTDVLLGCLDSKDKLEESVLLHTQYLTHFSKPSLQKDICYKIRGGDYNPSLYQM